MLDKGESTSDCANKEESCGKKSSGCVNLSVHAYSSTVMVVHFLADTKKQIL